MLSFLQIHLKLALKNPRVTLRPFFRCIENVTGHSANSNSCVVAKNRFAGRKYEQTQYDIPNKKPLCRYH